MAVTAAESSSACVRVEALSVITTVSAASIAPPPAAAKARSLVFTFTSSKLACPVEAIRPK